MKVDWDKKFEIGHERIDFEHRIFLGLIHEFRRLANASASGDRLRRCLREIYKYAEFHFISEENIMADIDYPERFDHAKQHAYLLNELRERELNLERKEIEALAVFDFLFEWFALHTTQTDRRIASFITTCASTDGDDRGLQPAGSGLGDQ